MQWDPNTDRIISARFLGISFGGLYYADDSTFNSDAVILF